MKYSIMRNWNVMRMVRLGLGMAIMIQALAEGSWALCIAGLIFTALPLLNVGCGVSNACTNNSVGCGVKQIKKDDRYEKMGEN